MTTGRNRLDQIVRGVDGVTAGPWDIKEETGWDEAWCDWHDVGPFSLMGPKANANSKHIARCSPDAMREIAAYVRDLEERLAKAAEALEPFAREADCYDPDEGDGDQSAWATPVYFKIRDLRRARTALSSIKGAK